MTRTIPVGYDILTIVLVSLKVTSLLYLREHTWRVTLGMGLVILGFLGLCVFASLAIPSLVHAQVFPFLDFFVAFTALGLPHLGRILGEALEGAQGPPRGALHVLALFLVAIDLAMISAMHGNLIEIFAYSLLLVTTVKLPHMHKNIDELQVLVTLLAAFSLWRFVHSLCWGHLVLGLGLTVQEGVKWILERKHE